jgi:hypothetical protein
LGASPGEAFEDAFESTFLSIIGKESVMPVGYPSIRVLNHNPTHHLWNNNGTWWVHFTVHFDQRKRRVRRSLKTRSLTEAVGFICFLLGWKLGCGAHSSVREDLGP